MKGVAVRRVTRSLRAGVCWAVLVFVVAQPGVAMAQYIEPVEATVVDHFRPPQHFGGPGNRGWEYATSPGSPVRAVAGGVVAFAGPIGGALYVSINHPDGLRTTYSQVSSIAVHRGEVVAAGSIIARTRTRFHFGVIDHGAYRDPATLFAGRGVGPPVLVRTPERGTRVSRVPVSSGYQ